MKLAQRYAAVFLLTLVAACAPNLTRGDQRIFEAKQNYAAALTLAVAYKRLPPCPTVSNICSDKATVTRLQKADDAAFALMEGAQKTVDAGGSNIDMAINAATQSVAAFSSITKTLGVK